MARCGCASSSCGCALSAGTNTTVTGAGTPGDPWVVNANVPCSAVRPCLSGINGVDYNPATGVIQADISTDVNNGLTLGSDTGLYVTMGAATVTTGPCGVLGNGSPTDPVRANVDPSWGWPCTQSVANGQSVYCDPATGQLMGDPPHTTVSASAADGTTTLVAGTLPACPGTTVLSSRNNIFTLTNPSSCRNMIVTLRFGGRLRADVQSAILADQTPIESGVNVMGQFSVNGGAFQTYRNATWATGTTNATVTAVGGDDFLLPAPITLAPGASIQISTRILANCISNNPVTGFVLNEPSIVAVGTTV